MKRTLFLIGTLFSIIISASAQTNFSMKLYAGSNAPWGTGQSVIIDSKGNGRYDLSDVKKGKMDSLSFTLSSAQMEKLSALFNQIQFFTLNASYNSKSRDGTRLSVEISDSGKTHSVHWINIHTRESTALLDNLNVLLKSRGITIHY